MSSRKLIVLTDGLDAFSGFFKQIVDSGLFKTFILESSELLQGSISEQLSGTRNFDIFLAMDHDFFSREGDKLRAYFLSTGINPFGNYLSFYLDKTVFKASLLEGKSFSGFLLDPAMDQESLSLYFLCYLSDLFEKSITSERLSDYIYHSFKGVVYSEILKMKKLEIERLNKELERRNRIDPLTNLFNRRALYEFLERERNRTVRNLFKMGSKQAPGRNRHYGHMENSPNYSQEFVQGNFGVFSIMMIDLDHFKRINDTYGHLIGDTVLRTVGNIFRKEDILREQDVVGRFGGEEFIIILPGTDGKKAMEPAIRLSTELKEHSFEANDGTKFNVTMSIGISEYHPFDKGNEEIIQRADKALYYAKQNGRNRTILYEEVFS